MIVRTNTGGVRPRNCATCGRTDSIARHPELVKKWVDVGLYAVLLGLEGSASTLEAVNKKTTVEINDQAIKILQDNGVIIWGAFIARPEWDAADFKRLADYVRSRNITHTQFTVLTPLPGTELYNQWRDRLLTTDYTCYDALHAVVPTKLPREEFYRNMAELYRQINLAPYFDMIRNGKLTIANMKQGRDMLAAMSQWENYARNDPILRPQGPAAPPK